MKFIRWQGLAAFLFILSLIAALWFFMIDGVVRNAIEMGGTKVVGARVDLASADMTLSPLGLTLIDLQVTDPDEPMKNMVQVGRIAFLMDPGNLLLGKVIVREMTVDGVKLNTHRKRSGEVKRKRSTKAPKVDKEAGRKDKKEAFSLPKLDIPDVKEILEKEPLETLKSLEAVRSAVNDGEEKWKRALAELPDSGKIDEYKERVREIEKGLKGLKGILEGAAKAKALKAEIKGDIDAVKSAKSEFRKDMNDLKQQIKGLEALPEEDLNRLRDKYSLSSEGLSNFSRMLFGGKIGELVSMAASWYEKGKPVIDQAISDGGEGEPKPERGKGVDVRFREFRPMPGLLIEKARISLALSSGDMKGEIRNITDNQGIVGSPTTFSFLGDNLKEIGKISIKGALNRLDPSKPTEHVSLDVDSYRMRDVELSKGKEFPVTMKKGAADFRITAEHDLKGFNAALDAGFKGVELASGIGQDAGSVVKALASTLADVKAFNLKADVAGQPDDYDVKVRSNLDDVLKKALGDMVKRESRRLEIRLKAEIEKKVREPLDKLNSKVGVLGGLDQKLSRYSEELEALQKDIRDDGKKKLKLPF